MGFITIKLTPFGFFSEFSHYGLFRPNFASDRYVLGTHVCVCVCFFDGLLEPRVNPASRAWIPTYCHGMCSFCMFLQVLEMLVVQICVTFLLKFQGVNFFKETFTMFQDVMICKFFYRVCYVSFCCGFKHYGARKWWSSTLYWLVIEELRSHHVYRTKFARHQMTLNGLLHAHHGVFVMFLRFLFLYMLIQDNWYTDIPVYDVTYIYIYTCMYAQDEYDVFSTKYDKTLDSS